MHSKRSVTLRGLFFFSAQIFHNMKIKVPALLIQSLEMVLIRPLLSRPMPPEEVGRAQLN